MIKQDILNQNEVIKAQTVENPAKESRKVVNQQKRQAIPPMWRILGQAQKRFKSQLTKDNNLKLRCIEAYLASESDDAPKFWGDFMRQVERLLDSRKYLKECQSLGCTPENLGEHIVFLGSSTLNKVLKYGVLNTIGNHFKLYTERFSPSEADIYRDDIISSLCENESQKSVVLPAQSVAVPIEEVA